MISERSIKDSVSKKVTQNLMTKKVTQNLMTLLTCTASMKARVLRYTSAVVMMAALMASLRR